MRLNVAFKTIIVAALIFAIAWTQFLYDATKVPVPAYASGGLSPEAVRLFDMGFNSTAASFLWVATMPEILDLFNNKTEYIADEAYVNAVDPKLSYPYAFSVLTLPIVPTSTGFTAGLSDATIIGERGLQNANPDWRIPYYLATNDYLYLNDDKDAALYFNDAAHTPGVPYYAARFAENFGNEPNQRDQTISLWETIRDSTNDPNTKATAQAYIDHLEIFNYLESAAAQYKKAYGAFPTNLNQLVAKGIISSIPQDPFGEQFVIDGTTGMVSVNLNTQ